MTKYMNQNVSQVPAALQRHCNALFYNYVRTMWTNLTSRGLCVTTACQLWKSTVEGMSLCVASSVSGRFCFRALRLPICCCIVRLAIPACSPTFILEKEKVCWRSKSPSEFCKLHLEGSLDTSQPFFVDWH